MAITIKAKFKCSSERISQVPKDNLKDLDEVDSEARAHLMFIPCETADDVLSAALTKF